MRQKKRGGTTNEGCVSHTRPLAEVHKGEREEANPLPLTRPRGAEFRNRSITERVDSPEKVRPSKRKKQGDEEKLRSRGSGKPSLPKGS